jgi:hypothetical protein
LLTLCERCHPIVEHERPVFREESDVTGERRPSLRPRASFRVRHRYRFQVGTGDRLLAPAGVSPPRPWFTTCGPIASSRCRRSRLLRSPRGCGKGRGLRGASDEAA